MNSWLGQAVSTSFGLGVILGIRADGIVTVQLQNASGGTFLGYFQFDSLTPVWQEEQFYDPTVEDCVAGPMALCPTDTTQVIGYVRKLEFELPVNKRLRAEQVALSF